MREFKVATDHSFFKENYPMVRLVKKLQESSIENNME
jgi:hypothetical protein